MDSNKYSILETDLKEAQKSNMSDLEKLQLEKSETSELLVESQNEAAANLKKYQDYRIKSEIQSVVSKYADKLVSPIHLPFILRTVLNPEIKDDKIMVGEMTFEAAFEEYLKQDENKSLLKNDLISGSGTKNNLNKNPDSSFEEFDIAKTKDMSQVEINEYMNKFS